MRRDESGDPGADANPVNTANPAIPMRPDPLVGLSGAQRLELARAKRAARWVGLILPLTLVAIGTVVTIAWIPRMPDPMSTHWGPGFEPDGFGPPWTNAAMALGLGLGLSAMYALQGLQRITPNATIWSPMHRFIPAMVLATVTLVQCTAIGTAWVQLDARDARDTGSTAGLLGLAFGLALVAGVAGFFAQPRLRIDGPDPGAVEPLALAPQERAVWVAEARLPGPMYAVVTALAALPVVALVTMLIVGSPVWWIAALPLFVFTLAWGIGAKYRVRVDDSGIEARAMLGWPAFRVAAGDIESVRTAEINPFAEFGGCGIRWAPGRFGIVLRTGPGIVVTRTDGRTWAVTLDRPEEGAALLAAVAERAKEAKNRTSDEGEAE